ncbi:MAG: hypothetical protein K0S41_1193 [Anaerocolumna sp.]|jgi:hypothetical protein|nr:hypothetical protein [Anaerocolumna sp.]MDF2587352.1 hypothetical protein [Anaerocolumna sp.]
MQEFNITEIEEVTAPVDWAAVAAVGAGVVVGVILCD